MSSEYLRKDPAPFEERTRGSATTTTTGQVFGTLGAIQYYAGGQPPNEENPSFQHIYLRAVLPASPYMLHFP